MKKKMMVLPGILIGVIVVFIVIYGQIYFNRGQQNDEKPVESEKTDLCESRQLRNFRHMRDSLGPIITEKMLSDDREEALLNLRKMDLFFRLLMAKNVSDALDEYGVYMKSIIPAGNDTDRSDVLLFLIRYNREYAPERDSIYTFMINAMISVSEEKFGFHYNPEILQRMKEEKQ